MATKEFNYSDFKRINIRFAMDFEIVHSDTYSITITGADSLINNIYASLEGDRLILGYSLSLFSFFTAPFTRTHARVALPDLREVDISGAAHGSIRGFNTPENFTLYVTGASHLDISGMDLGSMKWDLSGASRITGQVKVTGDAEIRITGASRIDLKGSAQNMNLEASGASHIDMLDFPVNNARVRLMGASRSLATINGKLDVSLDGAAGLEYAGQPTMGEVRVTGASTLKKR